MTGSARNRRLVLYDFRPRLDSSTTMQLVLLPSFLSRFKPVSAHLEMSRLSSRPSPRRLLLALSLDDTSAIFGNRIRVYNLFGASHQIACTFHAPSWKRKFVALNAQECDIGANTAGTVRCRRKAFF